MAKVVTTPSWITQRDYVNGFEYYTDFETTFNRLEHFPMDEGRMRPTTLGGTTYRYEFDLKDHLGNTRMTLTDANNNGIFDNYSVEVLQADDYYPFGMRITRKLTSSENNYTYNGKEHENDFGLNWYHYGARFYDPAVGRWWAVDPVDEMNSAYCFVGNSVINCFDPNGENVNGIVVNENGEVINTVTDKYGDSKWFIRVESSATKQIIDYDVHDPIADNPMLGDVFRKFNSGDLVNFKVDTKPANWCQNEVNLATGIVWSLIKTNPTFDSYLQNFAMAGSAFGVFDFKTNTASNVSKSHYFLLGDKAYNQGDFNNFMFGMASKKMGLTPGLAQMAAQVNHSINGKTDNPALEYNILDSSADQAAISNGWWFGEF